MSATSLNRVRAAAIARYLNTGETLTLTLVAISGSTTKQDLVAIHTLSASTVSAHLRRLARAGLVSISGSYIRSNI